MLLGSVGVLIPVLVWTASQSVEAQKREAHLSMNQDSCINCKVNERTKTSVSKLSHPVRKDGLVKLTVFDIAGYSIRILGATNLLPWVQAVSFISSNQVESSLSTTPSEEAGEVPGRIPLFHP